MNEHTAEYKAGWERAHEDREEMGRAYPEDVIFAALMHNGNTANWTAYDQGYLEAVINWQEVDE